MRRSVKATGSIRVGILLVLMSVIGMWAITGCPRSKPGPQPPPTLPKPKQLTLNVGAILPLTGPAASVGKVAQQGMTVAAELLSDEPVKPGQARVNVKLKVEDGRLDPTQSVSAFERLRAGGIRCFVTMGSGVCLALIPRVEREKVLLFANAAHPKISEAKGFVLRHSNTADQEAKLLLAQACDGLKKTRVGLLWVNDEFGRAFATAIKTEAAQKGAKVVQEVSFEKTGTDFRGEVQRVIAAKPEAVIVVGYGKALGLVIRRLREKGYDGPILVNLGFLITPDSAKTAGEAAKGIYTVAFDFDRDNPRFKQFADAYKARYNEEPAAWAIMEADTLALLTAAAGRSGSVEPETLYNTILKMGTFTAIGEEMHISPNGDVLPQLKVEKWEGNQ